MATPPAPENKVRFDKSINLGHALTIVSFCMFSLMQWNLMDKRVVVLEEARLAQRERDISRDVTSKDKFQEIRDALTDLRRSVEKVSDKVGAK